MDKAPYIAYQSPYGGQAIRARSVAQAWDKVSVFLTSCTDVLPSNPCTVILSIFESEDEDANDWFASAVDSATLLFGTGTRRNWYGGIYGLYLVEWSLKVDALHDALAFLQSFQPMPKTLYGPIELVLSYNFCFIDPDSGKLLDGQPCGFSHGDLTQYQSGLLVFLSRLHSAIFNGNFPFPAPEASFFQYLSRIKPFLPIDLRVNHLRHMIPTKNGEYDYVQRKVAPEVIAAHWG